ncbi:MAG: gliding motility lipoprotein GldH [Bacteroidota bacterium]|nr:gliding motility lipoprotein GldH [Bacteroidota bacterium]
MRIKNSIIGLFLLILLLPACNIDSVYENTHSIESGAWSKKQAIGFDIPVTDTINGHNIYITLRNTEEYPYSNLFIFVTTRSPKGAVKKDTIELTLADEKGKWYGRGLAGIWSYERIIKQNIRFPYSGKYHMEFVQAMRDDNLTGIKDIGIKVERVK